MDTTWTPAPIPATLIPVPDEERNDQRVNRTWSDVWAGDADTDKAWRFR